MWDSEEEVEECQWPTDVEVISHIEAHQIFEAASTFRDDGGLGWDNFHPKALRRMPRDLLKELERQTKEAEQEDSWTKVIGVVITARIPKGGGG